MATKLTVDDVKQYLGLAIKMLDFANTFVKNEKVKTIIDFVKSIMEQEWFSELLNTIFASFPKLTKEDMDKVVGTVFKLAQETK